MQVKVIEAKEPSMRVKKKVGLWGRFTKWIRGLWK